MNILYLLGNGFDLAQGLETSYSDFYAFLRKQTPRTELEKKVMDSIKSNYPTWANLEEGLGQYSAEWESREDFRNILAFLNGRLREYLMTQENRLQSLDLDGGRFIDDLCHPEDHLEPKGQAIFANRFKDERDVINIRCVTFNYTNTVETVLGDDYLKVGAFLYRHNPPCYFQGLMHIHGTLDSLMLLGVNDESQIANEMFRDDPEIRDEFIKPEINEGCMNTRNETFEEWIKAADVIVLFGVSIGETDSKWWHAIGAKIDSLHPALILYFPYDPDKDTEGHPNHKRRWTGEYLDMLQQRMDIQLEPSGLLRNICVGINKDFLKLV